jgi:hypothetical protein
MAVLSVISNSCEHPPAGVGAAAFEGVREACLLLHAARQCSTATPVAFLLQVLVQPLFDHVRQACCFFFFLLM